MKFALEVELDVAQISRLMRKMSRKYSPVAFRELKIERILAEALIEYAEEKSGTWMRNNTQLNDFIKQTINLRGE